MEEILFIAVLAYVAGGIGTLTGFGTATIMVPILLLLYSLPETLLLSGVVHWFGNLWKISLFRGGLQWRLILLFGIPGLILTWIGASLVYVFPEEILRPTLGVILILYTIYIFLHQTFKIKPTDRIAIIGGAVSGFLCGIFGVGGAIRGAILSTFDLPKAVYIATAGSIGLIIDSGRIVRYLTEGTTISSIPVWSLPIFILASFLGALTAKQVIDHIPQQQFRLVIMVFLSVVAIQYILVG